MLVVGLGKYYPSLFRTMAVQFSSYGQGGLSKELHKNHVHGLERVTSCHLNLKGLAVLGYVFEYQVDHIGSDPKLLAS